MSSNQILRLIACFLDYPDESLHGAKVEVLDIIDQSSLSSELKRRLSEFSQTQQEKDLLAWQEEYDALFERGRSLGLWLFEHVHGESRDRGQAMVDLLAKYKEAGLEISQHQLPDYIPLFLEFISTQGDEGATEWLLDVEHILGLLQCRLERRESQYAVLFESLLSLSGSTINLDELRQQVTKEKKDHSKKAIDKEWEEEEITFGAESGNAQTESDCSQSVRKPADSQRKDLDIPLNWVDFNADTTLNGGAAK